MHVVEGLEAGDATAEALRAEATGSLADLKSQRMSGDSLRYAFTLSLIADILEADGKTEVIDSELYVGWPDWGSHDAHAALRLALKRAKAGLPSAAAKDHARSVLPSTMNPEQLRQFMAEGQFWLESCEESHPSGVSYADAFNTALAYWSMPYRGREGRNRRFVVVGSHPHLGPEPVVVGLIEVGDDAPYSQIRDSFLSLTTDTSLQFLRDRGPLAAIGVAERLSRLRHAIRPIPGVRSRELAYVLERLERLRARAQGRSRVGDGSIQKKRLAYLVRLARGEQGFRSLAEGERIILKDLREGVRALHDLVLPRIHMEVTVCGALPPFSNALAGKLVVGFLGDPRIREVVNSTPGSIVASVLDPAEYLAVVPSHGLLAVTTKGLYPGHSALYNRASIPGAANAPLALRKLGDTKGTTTTLVSDVTARIATIINGLSEAESVVADTYGTGGAKRQRILEAAAASAGLPQSLVHAGIRRPVYGVQFTRNLPSVVWLGEEPAWALDATECSESYGKLAVENWRSRWLHTAARRLHPGNTPFVGLRDILEEQ